jgi:hypothetical protein
LRRAAAKTLLAASSCRQTNLSVDVDVDVDVVVDGDGDVDGDDRL